MLGQVWNAAVWLSSTIVVGSILVLAWAWGRSGARGAPARHPTLGDIETRDDLHPRFRRAVRSERPRPPGGSGHQVEDGVELDEG